MSDAAPDFTDGRLSAPTPLRGCQLVMLGLLRELDRACAALGLRYWLDSGTLLGAVRHGGFIPWDDDLDVSMLPRDYARFMTEGQGALPEGVFLQTKETDPGYDLPFAKLRDRYSRIAEPDGSDARCMSGIFIDIQPMDLFTEREVRWRRLFWLLYHDLGAEGAARSALRRAKRGVSRAFRAVARATGFEVAVRRVAGSGERSLLGYRWDYQMWWPSFNDAADVFPLGEIEFEGSRFPAPANPDAYLKKQFGDYMTLPPPDRRVPVHSSGIFLDDPCDHPEALRSPVCAAEDRP